MTDEGLFVNAHNEFAVSQLLDDDALNGNTGPDGNGSKHALSPQIGLLFQKLEQGRIIFQEVFCES